MGPIVPAPKGRRHRESRPGIPNADEYRIPDSTEFAFSLSARVLRIAMLGCAAFINYLGTAPVEFSAGFTSRIV
jgi:hypothetical protein